MHSLAHYMAQYDHEHSSPWNRLLHGVAIPVVFAGIVFLALAWWRAGAALFLSGWLLLFLGHRIEGNQPAFFRGPVYFLVGPLWVAREILGIFTGKGSSKQTTSLPGRTD